MKAMVIINNYKCGLINTGGSLVRLIMFFLWCFIFWFFIFWCFIFWFFIFWFWLVSWWFILLWRFIGRVRSRLVSSWRFVCFVGCFFVILDFWFIWFALLLADIVGDPHAHVKVHLGILVVFRRMVFSLRHGSLQSFPLQVFLCLFNFNLDIPHIFLEQLNDLRYLPEFFFIPLCIKKRTLQIPVI